MKNRREYRAALSAEYALGTLRGPARLQFEQQIRQDSELAAEVARWQEAFAQLDNSLTPEKPPESVWKKIQLQLPPEPTLAPLPAGKKYRSRFNRAYIGWAIAACLAAVLLLPRLWEISGSKTTGATPVAVLINKGMANNGAASSTGQWIVMANNNTQQLTITPLHAVSVTGEHSLELWIIPAGGKPKSLGLISSDAPTALALNNVQANRGSTLAISLEPKGGSPTGQPTGSVLYSGRI